MLWDDVSRLLAISFDAIKKLVQESPSRITAPTPAPVTTQNRPTPTRKDIRQKKFPLDWEFFKGALRYPEAFLSFPKEDWVGFLKDQELEAILLRLWETQSASKMVEILEELSKSQTCPEILDAVSEPLLKEVASTPNEPQWFAEVAKRISERRKKAQIHGIANQVRMSQRLGDDQEQIKLLEQLRNLRSASAPTPQEPTSPKTGPQDH